MIQHYSSPSITHVHTQHGVAASDIDPSQQASDKDKTDRNLKVSYPNECGYNVLGDQGVS